MEFIVHRATNFTPIYHQAWIDCEDLSSNEYKATIVFKTENRTDFTFPVLIKSKVTDGSNRK